MRSVRMLKVAWKHPHSGGTTISNHVLHWRCETKYGVSPATMCIMRTVYIERTMHNYNVLPYKHTRHGSRNVDYHFIIHNMCIRMNCFFFSFTLCAHSCKRWLIAKLLLSLLPSLVYCCQLLTNFHSLYHYCDELNSERTKTRARVHTHPCSLHNEIFGMRL